LLEKYSAKWKKRPQTRREQAQMLRHVGEPESNMILVSEFAEIFDGFSLGLTQLVLGVDRNSEIVVHVFDERNLAVNNVIASFTRAAKTEGRKIGISGQAPSDYPDFAVFLVEHDIDSISLNPDAMLKTTLAILAMESGEARKAAVLGH